MFSIYEGEHRKLDTVSKNEVGTVRNNPTRDPLTSVHLLQNVRNTIVYLIHVFPTAFFNHISTKIMNIPARTFYQIPVSNAWSLFQDAQKCMKDVCSMLQTNDHCLKTFVYNR